MKRCQLTLLLLTLVTVGCATSYKHQLNFNPSEPLRVAVLPAAQVSGKGEFRSDDGKLLVDDVALLSRAQDSSPEKIIERHILTSLNKSALSIVSPGVVSAQLSHSGYIAKGVANHQKIRSTPLTTLCQLLYCDAVLFVDITRWDRSYYAIESVNTVGINLRLVRAADGVEIFASQSVDSDSRGLSKIPTGFSSAVIEPIRGLDAEIINELSGRVVSKAVSPLIATAAKPEELTEPPPGIVAASHDADTGLISVRAPLKVLALGTPGLRASFSIGSEFQNIPMIEKERGHYYGEFYLLGNSAFRDQPVVITLTDRWGRSSSRPVGRPNLSTE